MSDDNDSLGVIAAVVFGDMNELLIGMIIARIASIVRMDELDIEKFLERADLLSFLLPSFNTHTGLHQGS